MIQIAESTKMERAIKHLLIGIDPKLSLREESFTLYPDKGGGIQSNGRHECLSLVINGDKKLTIDHTTVQMEDSGQFEAGSYSTTGKIKVIC